MPVSGIRTRTTTVSGLVIALELALLSTTRAQVHNSKPYAPFDWPSKPPADCPFEPSKDIVGITFTGRHREYTNADCWFPSWASDGNMYSPFSDPREVKSSWCIGDQAYLLRVVPSPKTVNDAGKYEFFAGHDDRGKAVWTSERRKMQPLVTWNGRVGSTSITYNPRLKKYLFCTTDGRAANGPYDTYILESGSITGPWKLVVFMEDFGEQGYFVNIPSKFISEDGRTAWLCYAANFRSGGPNPTPLKSDPPGSRYAMNLQEIQLGNKRP